MNIFGNWIFSVFMAAGTSFSAPETTFPTEHENILELKEKKSFNYVAASSNIYPSPSIALGHRIKSLYDTNDFAIGVSYMHNASWLFGDSNYVQGHAHYGYYQHLGFDGVYYGPRGAVAVWRDFTSYRDDSWGVIVRPTFVIGKEYETFFHQMDFCGSFHFVSSAIDCLSPGILLMIGYEIGVKF